MTIAAPPSLRTAKPPPRQAVILAGGRGTRLGELGDRMPKAMVPFHGRPFAEYLVEQLRGAGFQRLLFLLGYKADQISDHFEDGERFGVEISYSISALENDTGTRVKLAESSCDPVFMLLYCDNYWPLRLDSMWRDFCADDRTLAQVTVYRNRDQRTRDNLRIGCDGRVEIYDKSRQAPGLSGVDIGYLLLDRSVLSSLPDDRNHSFEAELYPHLVAEGQLGAFQSDHRYYSVGTPERLPETEVFLARRPTVIFDRDGVLNAKAAPGQYITSVEDWRWLPGAREAIARLTAAGVRIIVVTNQAGIARGHVSRETVDRIHEHMKADAERAGGRIEAVYLCPHHWDENCDCRKPKPGMLIQAQRDFTLDLSRTPFVGDDVRDGEAAAACGTPFFHVRADLGVAEALDALLQASISSTGQTVGN